MKLDNVWIYDIEVLKYDFCVVFENLKGEEVLFVNDVFGLNKFLKDKTIVGYNNHHYDDIMVSKMIKHPNKPELYKKYNDSIINQGIRFKSSLNCTSLDVSQEINANKISLKQLQLNYGKDIKESNIDFNIDRKLTEEELNELVKYCKNDVKFTKFLFLQPERQEYFKSKFRMLELFDLLPNYIKKTIPTICGIAFKNENTSQFTKVDCINYIKQLDNIPNEVKSNWIDNLHLDKVDNYKYKIDNNVYNFTFGALSMSNKKSVFGGEVYHYDFASLFPSIICKYNLLGDKTEVYKKLMVERVGLKKTDPLLATVYKLLLNKTYGAHGNKYNLLYNKYIMYTICFISQDLLFGLCKNITQNRVYNAKTDGVYVIGKRDLPTIEGFTIDYDCYTDLVQSDVNCYIAKGLDNKVTVKGRYSNMGHNFFERNNDLAICNIAVVQKILYNIDIVDTIFSNLDKPLLFQKTIKHGKTFNFCQGVNSSQKVKLTQKVNRAFACKNGLNFEKVKLVDGWEKSTTIDKDFYGWVYNGDLQDEAFVKQFKENVDLNYYYQKSLHILKQYKLK